jgi:hypothetical protein
MAVKKSLVIFPVSICMCLSSSPGKDFQHIVKRPGSQIRRRECRVRQLQWYHLIRCHLDFYFVGVE